MRNLGTLLSPYAGIFETGRTRRAAVDWAHAFATGDQRRVAVLGAGAWGTALAIAFARSGALVKLWGRSETRMWRIAQSRHNVDRLPGAELPTRVTPTADIARATHTADAIFLAVPSSGFRQAAKAVSETVRPGVPVVSCAKGLDVKSSQLLTATIEDEIPHASAMVLSGPSFAAEVASGQPTSLVIAGDGERGAAIADGLSSSELQITASEDVVGVQVAGVMKNVVAIACGVAAGLSYGANTRASILARGFQEAGGLAEALGGDKATLFGAAGAGDLAMTCTAPQSRNFSLGFDLAKRTQAGAPKTFEGAENAANVLALATDAGVDAPVTRAVVDLLTNVIDAPTLIERLFAQREPAPHALSA